MTREPLTRTVQHISGPAELVQAVPYLLGFHPSDSLVLVGLAERALVVTARVDLADVFGGALGQTVAAMHRGGTRELVAVVYAAAGLDPTGVVGPVHAAADENDCHVTDILHVADGRWHSLECTDPDCCPPDGTALDDGPGEFATAATVAGVVALADRAALARQLDPDPDRDDPALARALGAAENAQHGAVLAGRAAARRRAVTRALLAAARALDDPEENRLRTTAVRRDQLDGETLARFGVALAETAVRDAAWMAIEGGRVDGRVLWRELARRLPGPYDAPALFLFAWASWRAGDGALANIAVDRCVQADPRYSAADLLQAALHHGVDPRTMPRLRLPA